MPNAELHRSTPQQRNGVGLGLRWDFIEEVVDGPDLAVDFFEVSPENYMRRGGYYPAQLERLKERYPLITHGLSLSIGAVDDPDAHYLRELRGEIERTGSPFHSDHLCFSSAGSRMLHELLPLKQSRDNVARVADRARRVQDVLGVPFALENITYYLQLGKPELSELDFLQGVLERSGAGLLLDVNNVYVNSLNHGFDPQRFIAELDLSRVVEIHVAGHTRKASGLVLDTHGESVADPVFQLLAFTLERTGPCKVLLERDNNLPELAELLTEVCEAQRVAAEVPHRRRRARIVRCRPQPEAPLGRPRARRCRSASAPPSRSSDRGRQPVCRRIDAHGSQRSANRAPSLHRFRRVERPGVEADARLRGMFMDHVEHFFKQEKVFTDGAHTSTNHDAVIAALLQSRSDHVLCGFAKIGKAQLGVVTQSVECGDVLVQPALNLLGRHARKSGVSRICEVDELRLQAN